MGKSGRKKVSFQDMEHEVSKATSISFKTIDKSDTKQVSFKTIEETNNKLIPFKTFNAVGLRQDRKLAALKDSFTSENKSALDDHQHSWQEDLSFMTRGEIQP